MLNSDLLESRLGIVSPSHFVNDFSRNACFSWYILLQARNQEFFRAREFSSNLGSSINIHLQHEKKRPRRKKSTVFSPRNSFKSEILPIDDWNQGTFFQFLKKGRGDLPPSLLPPPPSSYTPVLIDHISLSHCFYFLRYWAIYVLKLFLRSWRHKIWA